MLERVAELGIPVPGRDTPATVREPDPAVDPFQDPGLAQRITLEQAVAAAQAGEVDALLTGPVDKARLAAAGFPHPGHTNFLAAAAGVPVAMMFVSPALRVVPATVHVPMRQVPEALETHLAPTLVTTAIALQQDFGIDRPRVAVAGLNPHAGEGGLIGQEERTILEPAMQRAAADLSARGHRVQLLGPLPGDTVFHLATRGECDAVVASYHDQALIPIKLLAFDRAVNLTVGLPYIRTSPAHGTAPDLAWSGRANPGSTRAALELAVSLAKNRALSKSANPPRESV